MFGSSVKKSIVRTQAFSWNKQPWTLGALSSASPGAREARKVLAEPVNNIVWFAGEAVNQTYWATVGGAWQDGERAADSSDRASEITTAPPRNASSGLPKEPTPPAASP